MYSKNGDMIIVYGDMMKNLIYFLNIAKTLSFPNPPSIFNL